MRSEEDSWLGARTAGLVGVVCVLLMAGCAAIERASPGEAPQVPAATVTESTSQDAARPAASKPKAPAAPVPAASTPKACLLYTSRCV